MEDLRDLHTPENSCVTRVRAQSGGGNPNASELVSKEVKKIKIVELVRNDMYRHPDELADCELKAELDGKMAKPLHTLIVDPLNVSNQTISASRPVTHLLPYSPITLSPSTNITHSTTFLKKKIRRIAFTLAEVLITLGIIGIVAALTIPNVIQHYKKQEVVARLKSTESIFSQMLYFSVAKNGDPQNWDLGDHEGASSETTSSEEIATRITEKYFLPYLKAEKYYGFVSLKQAGYPIYPKANGSLQKHNLDNTNWKACIIELPNGMTVFLRPDSTAADENGISHFLGFLLYIDINGRKGPNVWGRDLFLANIDTKKGRFVWPGSSNSRSYLKKACSEDFATRCGTLIWKDGYEIKKDYPIRL